MHNNEERMKRDIKYIATLLKKEGSLSKIEDVCSSLSNILTLNTSDSHVLILFRASLTDFKALFLLFAHYNENIQDETIHKLVQRYYGLIDKYVLELYKVRPDAKRIYKYYIIDSQGTSNNAFQILKEILRKNDEELQREAVKFIAKRWLYDSEDAKQSRNSLKKTLDTASKNILRGVFREYGYKECDNPERLFEIMDLVTSFDLVAYFSPVIDSVLKKYEDASSDKELERFEPFLFLFSKLGEVQSSQLAMVYELKDAEEECSGKERCYFHSKVYFFLRIQLSLFSKYFAEKSEEENENKNSENILLDKEKVTKAVEEIQLTSNSANIVFEDSITRNEKSKEHKLERKSILRNSQFVEKSSIYNAQQQITKIHKVILSLLRCSSEEIATRTINAIMDSNVRRAIQFLCENSSTGKVNRKIFKKAFQRSAFHAASVIPFFAKSFMQEGSNYLKTLKSKTNAKELAAKRQRIVRLIEILSKTTELSAECAQDLFTVFLVILRFKDLQDLSSTRIVALKSPPFVEITESSIWFNVMSVSASEEIRKWLEDYFGTSVDHWTDVLCWYTRVIVLTEEIKCDNFNPFGIIQYAHDHLLQRAYALFIAPYPQILEQSRVFDNGYFAYTTIKRFLTEGVELGAQRTLLECTEVVLKRYPALTADIDIFSLVVAACVKYASTSAGKLDSTDLDHKKLLSYEVLSRNVVYSNQSHAKNIHAYEVQCVPPILSTCAVLMSQCAPSLFVSLLKEHPWLCGYVLRGLPSPPISWGLELTLVDAIEYVYSVPINSFESQMTFIGELCARFCGNPGSQSLRTLFFSRIGCIQKRMVEYTYYSTLLFEEKEEKDQVYASLFSLLDLDVRKFSEERTLLTILHRALIARRLHPFLRIVNDLAYIKYGLELNVKPITQAQWASIMKKALATSEKTAATFYHIYRNQGALQCLTKYAEKKSTISASLALICVQNKIQFGDAQGTVEIVEALWIVYTNTTQMLGVAFETLRSSDEIIEYIDVLVLLLRGHSQKKCKELLLDLSQRSILYAVRIIYSLRSATSDLRTSNDMMLYEIENDILLSTADLFGDQLKAQFVFNQNMLNASKILQSMRNSGKNHREKLPVLVEMRRLFIPEEQKIELLTHPGCTTRTVLSSFIMQSAEKCPYMLKFKARKSGIRCTPKAIFKYGDDFRSDVFAMNLMRLIQGICEKAHVGIMLRPYKVIPTGRGCGLIEVVDGQSRDGIGKSGYSSLADYFSEKYGSEDSLEYRRARDSFVRSAAGYSLFCYLACVRDRHNANVLIDESGSIVHIDFGFMMDIAPGRLGVSVEDAPFKLTAEMLDIMRDDGEALFRMLLAQSFVAVRRRASELIMFVEIMNDASLPCFKPYSLENFKQRLRLELSERDAADFTNSLVDSSISSKGTWFYDKYQNRINNISC